MPFRIWLTMKIPRLDRRLLLEIGQVWVAATLANVMLYLFQIIVGRGLGPEEFSLFGALFGIVYLAGALSNTASVAVAGLVARARAARSGVDPNLLLTSSLLQMCILGGAILLGVGLASPFLAAYLHSDSATPVVVTGAIIFTQLLLSTAQGALQGHERFTWYAANHFIHAASRLLFGVAALASKLGVLGVFTAIGLSNLLSLAVGVGVLRPPFKASLRTLSTGALAGVFAPTLVASLAIAFPTSFDVMIVRHFFSPSEAGQYAGAALMGRVVLFLPLAISVVLFPKIAHASALGSAARGLLWRGLGVTALLSATVTGVLALVPGFVISILLGNEYADARSLIPLYALSMLLFSLVVVFTYYHLAIKNSFYLYFLLLPHILLEVALIYLFHNSLAQVILMLLYVNLSLVVLSAVITWLRIPRPAGREADIQAPAATAQSDS